MNEENKEFTDNTSVSFLTSNRVKEGDGFPKCYIGPSFKGAYTGSVYRDQLPPMLEDVIRQNPMIDSLVVPVSELAAANVALENPKSSLSRIFGMAKDYLKNYDR